MNIYAENGDKVIFTGEGGYDSDNNFARLHLEIGKEYEVERLGATYGMAELAIHSPFYQELNRQLGLDNDEFWSSYLDDPVMKSRMDKLDH